MSHIIQILLGTAIGAVVANQIQHELWAIEPDVMNPRIVRYGSLAVVMLLAIALAYVMQVGP